MSNANGAAAPAVTEFRPHPEFRLYTDAELTSGQEKIAESIQYAKQGDDPVLVSFFETEMLLLQAERKRRNGVDNSLNSFNSSTVAAATKPILAAAALYGLAGDIVRTIEPFSESDPVAILTNVLTAFGNVVGPTPFFRVEYTRHHLNLFVAQVGDTSKGRKGTGWSTPRYMFKEIDFDWKKDRVTSGLSSGEGLIFAVRDERTEHKPIRESGHVVGYEDIIVDQGVSDKRLMVVEEELSQALKVMSREGNILSATILQAWDGGDLHPLTKSNPIKATGAHISIIGHITRTELLRYLTATEQSNGFANRFCWFWVARSKIIPSPKGVPEETLLPLVRELEGRVNFARKVSEISRDSEAEEKWTTVYPRLSDAKPGMAGACISRSEAQTMRLACLYALLDESELVRLDHLNAALALWDYSEQSAIAIFGDLSGDPSVDKAKAALREKGQMTMTDLHGLFGRNMPKPEIDRVVAALVNGKVAIVETVGEGGGKPVTVLQWATN